MNLPAAFCFHAAAMREVQRIHSKQQKPALGQDFVYF